MEREAVYLVLGLIVIAVVVVAVMAWQRGKTARGNPPPEVRSDGPPPPEDRRKDWDPRERYDG